jgi:hypothetical protein
MDTICNESDEAVLVCEVSDEALEIAAGARHRQRPQRSGAVRFARRTIRAVTVTVIKTPSEPLMLLSRYF